MESEKFTSPVTVQLGPSVPYPSDIDNHASPHAAPAPILETLQILEESPAETERPAAAMEVTATTGEQENDDAAAIEDSLRGPNLGPKSNSAERQSPSGKGASDAFESGSGSTSASGPGAGELSRGVVSEGSGRADVVASGAKSYDPRLDPDTLTKLRKWLKANEAAMEERDAPRARGIRELRDSMYEMWHNGGSRVIT